MIKKIDLYIIKKFLGTYVFAIALIISIVVVFDVNEKLDALLKAPLKATVFDYYLNFIPYFVSLFSPLFTFISVIFFTSKLADNSEIIAMLASGISFKRLLVPYMVSAGIIAGVNFYLNSHSPGNVHPNRIPKHIRKKQKSRLREQHTTTSGTRRHRLYKPIR